MISSFTHFPGNTLSVWKKKTHCIYAPHFLYPLICWWTLELIPFAGYCEHCCDMHGHAIISVTCWIKPFRCTSTGGIAGSHDSFHTESTGAVVVSTPSHSALPLPTPSPASAVICFLDASQSFWLETKSQEGSWFAFRWLLKMLNTFFKYLLAIWFFCCDLSI